MVPQRLCELLFLSRIYAVKEISAFVGRFHNIYARSIKKIHIDNGEEFVIYVITALLCDEEDDHS